MKEHVCPICKGTGTMHWDDGCYEACYLCGGTGKILLKSIDEYNLDDNKYKIDPGEYNEK
jgi:RecJ-like exonuclease